MNALKCIEEITQQKFLKLEKERSLDLKGQKVLSYLRNEIGHSKYPTKISIRNVMKYTDLTWKEAYNRLKKLKDFGLLQYWSVTYHSGYRWERARYYRFPF